jgi:hypothetical protein
MKDDNTKSAAPSKTDSASKRDRVIGEGMTSLDSTQAPLKTSDGLPDYEAMTGGKEPSARPAGDEKDDRTSK